MNVNGRREPFITLHTTGQSRFLFLINLLFDLCIAWSGHSVITVTGWPHKSDSRYRSLANHRSLPFHADFVVFSSEHSPSAATPHAAPKCATISHSSVSLPRSGEWSTEPSWSRIIIPNIGNGIWQAWMPSTGGMGSSVSTRSSGKRPRYTFMGAYRGRSGSIAFHERVGCGRSDAKPFGS